MRPAGPSGSSKLAAVVRRTPTSVEEPETNFRIGCPTDAHVRQRTRDQLSYRLSDGRPRPSKNRVPTFVSVVRWTPTSVEEPGTNSRIGCPMDAHVRRRTEYQLSYRLSDGRPRPSKNQRPTLVSVVRRTPTSVKEPETNSRIGCPMDAHVRRRTGDQLSYRLSDRRPRPSKNRRPTLVSVVRRTPTSVEEPETNSRIGPLCRWHMQRGRTRT